MSLVLSVLVLALSLGNPSLADPVVVHHREGVAHGFLMLSSLAGNTLAYGDLVQIVKGDQVTTETVFHFKDGSLYDDTAILSQDQTFHLISDHLVQKGPSFPHLVDMSIDVPNQMVTIHAQEKDSSEHMDLPDDLSNGIILILVRNISPETPETKVSLLSASSKPRLVHLVIVPKGERTFTFAGSTRKATDFHVKVEIGGVAGVVAPVIGKQPPEIHIWISQGASPTFVQLEGPLYEGGPIWRIRLAPLHVTERDSVSTRNEKR